MTNVTLQPFRFPDKPIETGPTVVASLKESDWIAQCKYDGWRLGIYQDTNDVRCLTRVGNPIQKEARAKFHTNFVNDIKNLQLPCGTVLDAEFVGPRGHHKPEIYIFDMLAWNNQWLTDEPFEKRWERCLQLKPRNDINLAHTVESGFMELFNDLKQQWINNGCGMDLCEGIVLKKRNGKLQLDRKKSCESKVQIKLKYRDIRDRRY